MVRMGGVDWKMWGLLTRVGFVMRRSAMLCCDVAVRCKPIDTQLRQCIEYSIAGAISRMVLFTNSVDNYVALKIWRHFGS